jgi:threonine/homoserine/homoserine lactone efflux protein
MSIETPDLIAALVFIIPMCFTPGPNNVLCAAHGSRYGVRNSLSLISGMAVGWSILGLGIAAGATFIEENKIVFQILTYIGTIYMVYLGYKIAISTKVDDSDTDERLGFWTGLTLQMVNGKAWFHFLVLMTTFGTVLGEGYEAKAGLVLLNLSFGFAAVLSWTAFGTGLRKLFSGNESGIKLNQMMGFLLVLVAIWIVMPK